MNNEHGRDIDLARLTKTNSSKSLCDTRTQVISRVDFMTNEILSADVTRYLYV